MRSIVERPLSIIPPKHVVVAAADTVPDTVQRKTVTSAAGRQSSLSRGCPRTWFLSTLTPRLSAWRCAPANLCHTPLPGQRAGSGHVGTRYHWTRLRSCPPFSRWSLSSTVSLAFSPQSLIHVEWSSLVPAAQLLETPSSLPAVETFLCLTSPPGPSVPSRTRYTQYLGNLQGPWYLLTHLPTNVPTSITHSTEQHPPASPPPLPSAHHPGQP